jgi:hypothetical protein
MISRVRTLAASVSHPEKKRRQNNLISFYLPNEIRRKMHIFNVKSVRDKNVFMESLKYLYIK